MFGLIWQPFLVILGVVVFTPLRLSDLAARPAPASDYDTAMRRADEVQAEEREVISPRGGTIFLTHGFRTPRVYVLLHGLTASPLQFEAFGRQLFDDGDNVFIPRLPRHAERDGNIKSLGRLSVVELRAFGDRAIDVAAGLGDTVIVVGLSAGGTVAAWAGQNRAEVRRVVLVAPALAVAKVPTVLHGAVLRTALRLPNVRRSSDRFSEEPDRISGWASHALAEIIIMGDVVRNAARSQPPRAAEAVFLISASDRTVPNGAAVDLARSWSRHHTSVRIFEFPDTLRLPHDVIDPRQPRGDTAVVYPALAAISRGDQPPTSVIDLTDSARRP